MYPRSGSQKTRADFTRGASVPLARAMAKYVLVDVLGGKGPLKVPFDPNSPGRKKPVTVKALKGAVTFALDLEDHELEGKILQASNYKLWPDDTPYVMTGVKAGDVVRFVTEPPEGIRISLDVAHEARAIATFERCDANKDGVIDVEELSVVCKSINSGAWTDDRLERLLLAMDVTNDGIIQYDVFCHWVFVSEDAIETSGEEEMLLIRDFRDALEKLRKREEAEAATSESADTKTATKMENVGKATIEEQMTLELLEQQYSHWLEDASTASGRNTCHAIYETWIRHAETPHSSLQPVCILGGIDVGEEELLSYGATHVLSIISRKRRQSTVAENAECFERLVLDLEDDIEADLLSILPEALSFLDNASRHGLCYVHCEQGRSRSASVVIAWLMHRQEELGQKPSLLKSFAAVASRRRISALNYGFFAKLCDFEASLGICPPSLPLLSFFMLQFRGSGGMWTFKPPPDAAEIRNEYGRALDEKDEFGCPPPQRIRCLRKIIQGFDFALRRLSDSSQACKLALHEM